MGLKVHGYRINAITVMVFIYNYIIIKQQLALWDTKKENVVKLAEKETGFLFKTFIYFTFYKKLQWYAHLTNFISYNIRKLRILASR